MISLIHPSRGRPEKAFQTANLWMDAAGTYCQYILSLDEDDPYLPEYKALFERLPMVVNANTCVVEAANHAAKLSTGDVLLYLSDDFKCFDNWAAEVLKHFVGITKPLLIKVDDKLQTFHKDVLTMPIMNRALYNELGYFFHPGYKSMWCDCDLYHTVKNMDALKLCPELIFEHHHYVNGKAKRDETYDRSTANWNQGLALYNDRKRKNFPR